jgi:hypothetical protein
VHEQTVPLEVQFEPGGSSVFRNLLRIAWLLLLGALLALALRVMIPNYRRKKLLKEQIGDTAKATRSISDQVDSMLRVLLRVERLGLERLRHTSWISGPQFPELAGRVEQGLAVLRRKIGLTRRLDAALAQLTLRAEQELPPTRLLAAEAQLDMACSALMRDQLGEHDWVLIEQRLDGGEKLLAGITPEDKDAFKAQLMLRWKAVREFFGVEGRKLKVPANLTGCEAAFPPAEALPKETDTDGSEWIETIGLARADLQISALEILREAVFVATAGFAGERGQRAKQRLTELCTSPSAEDLAAARLLLREMAEGFETADIIQADIEMDPQSLQTEEKAHLAVRFRNPAMNTASARRSIRCLWSFSTKRAKATESSVSTEYGWQIYRYFPADTAECNVSVRFYHDGEPIKVSDAETAAPLEYSKPVPLRQPPRRRSSHVRRVAAEALPLLATLLIPIAALAVTQSDQGTTGRWWELIGVGFASETIRGILEGKSEPGVASSQAAPQP